MIHSTTFRPFRENNMIVLFNYSKVSIIVLILLIRMDIFCILNHILVTAFVVLSAKSNIKLRDNNIIIIIMILLGIIYYYY